MRQTLRPPDLETINEALAQRLSSQQAPPHSFRFLFTLVYVGITGSIAYFTGLWVNSDRLLAGGNLELAVLLVLLVGLDRVEQGRYKGGVPLPIAIVLLLVRMALFEGIVALDRSMLSMFLYPVIPFQAYFAFGSTVSSLLSLLYLSVAVFRIWQLDPMWYLNVETASLLVAFVFVLVFMQVVAPVIARDEQNRRRSEQLLDDLRASHIKLQVYAAQVGELAAMEERNRLARDIHDSLGHYLTLINIQLEKALAYKEHNPQEATQSVLDAKHAASEALQDVRRSVGALRTVKEDFSLRSALQELVARVDEDSLPVSLSIQGDEEGYNRTVLMALYRAAQEGMTNTQRYAQASQVHLDLTFGEQQARLVLRDDGQGFDTATLNQPATAKRQGFGLQGIRERVELVSGQMTLQSKPEQGTELVISVPKNPTKLVTDDWLDLQISKVREP